MRSTAAIFAATVAVLGLSACNREPDANANNVVIADNGATLDSPAPAPSPTQAFANAVITGNQYEIDLAAVADLNSSASSATKRFAAQMATQHSASNDKLRVALAQLNPPPMADSTPTADQKAMLENLRTKRGADFDAAFKAAQVAAHEESLAALNSYAASGDTPALVEFAKGMIPTVTAHLNAAKGL